MRYHEAAGFLFDLRRYPPRPGLDATAALLDAAGDPHRRVPVVQVAGSNGKGSTARMVESVLREAGLDVGLYTSPHLEDVRERIRVNGRKIREGAVREFVEEVEDYVVNAAAAGSEAPTFFEALTAMAYWEFARQEVDVAVVEVGIGGRYDATSVAEPIASAVTAVTLEHTDVLGDTVEEIARDKAAVAPEERPLVTAAEGDALAAIEDEAETLTVGDENADVEARYDGRRDVSEAAVSLAGPDWALAARVPLPGRHQARNAGVAAALARQVGDELGRSEAVAAALARGLHNATWPGRFEVFDTVPLTVLDGAHNPGAMEAVADTLAADDYEDLHLVVGALTDKDHVGMAEALPEAARVTVCRPDTERAETTAVLAAAFEAAGAEEVRETASVEAALDAALADAGEDDAVLVTGSLYTVAEARERWTRQATPLAADGEEEMEAALRRAHVASPEPESHAGRSLRIRLRPAQARALQEAVLTAGGACQLSALAEHGERVEVVLSGSEAELDAAFDSLDAPGVVSDLRAALEAIETGDPWDERTAVMGILNVTPDSFHDGGEYDEFDAALERAEAMVADGADIIDVGGESTRPGAEPVPAEEEIERVVPVVEALADADALVSVDTRKADVARAALEAGADILNDVSGLADPEMARVAAEHDASLVVMHSIDAPVVPEREVAYDDVVGDVIDELREPVLSAVKAGVPRENVIVDPGIGFGKSATESFEMLRRTGEFEALGCPVLVGHSHKSMFEAVESYPDRGGYATAAATGLAAAAGADIVRVHDVPENVTAVRTAEATERGIDGE